MIKVIIDMYDNIKSCGGGGGGGGFMTTNQQL